ncbi:hypothetical protein CPLU01_00836 [Colletotrichum plurivorum]|uniref:Uncharacterized protein n=1 Tax=Colletotrichum plurivorum TaxID=2175906 RepID=A0A8H6NQS2_9PEZI|nr:hypothetical protein CPLU01_00836 [Colletotrichum plurivorum]
MRANDVAAEAEGALVRDKEEVEETEAAEGKKDTYEFSKPLSAPWGEAQVIPSDGWERMMVGVWPQQMEDRWIVAHVVDDGEEGIVFARSWTGFLIAKVFVIPAPNDATAKKVARITWEGDNERWGSEDGEAAAKRLVARFARDRFQVDLVDGEIPDDY